MYIPDPSLFSLLTHNTQQKEPEEGVVFLFRASGYQCTDQGRDEAGLVLCLWHRGEWHSLFHILVDLRPKPQADIQDLSPVTHFQQSSIDLKVSASSKSTVLARAHVQTQEPKKNIPNSTSSEFCFILCVDLVHFLFYLFLLCSSSFPSNLPHLTTLLVSPAPAFTTEMTWLGYQHHSYTYCQLYN